MCFQRNLMTFAKARPAQMIFISTSIIHYRKNCVVPVGGLMLGEIWKRIKFQIRWPVIRWILAALSNISLYNPC